jgi:hypothetical protein
MIIATDTVAWVWNVDWTSFHLFFIFVSDLMILCTHMAVGSKVLNLRVVEITILVTIMWHQSEMKPTNHKLEPVVEKEDSYGK